jgi:uncharacterized protein
MSLALMQAVFIAAYSPPPIPPPAEQVSADCTAPTYASDQLVCSDPELRALDWKMATLVRQIGTDAIDAAAPGIENQYDWLRQRSLCAMKPEHRGCLLQAYRLRIEALERLRTAQAK